MKATWFFVIGFFFIGCSNNNSQQQLQADHAGQGLSKAPSIDVSGLSPCIDEAVTDAKSTNTLLPCGPRPAQTKEALCDGKDDDGDGLIDERCCVCVIGAPEGDTNGDSVVDQRDMRCPILLSVNKTTTPGLAGCQDVNKDGRVDWQDASRIAEIMNAI